MKQEKESLLFQFFLAQVRLPSRNDWVSQVIKDLEEIHLDIELKILITHPKKNAMIFN